MLLARVLGRHGFAISILLGGVLMAMNGAVGEGYGVYQLFRTDDPGDTDSVNVWTVLQSRPFLTGFYVSYLFSFVYCFAIEQDAVDRLRDAAKHAWMSPDPTPPRFLAVCVSFLPFLVLSIATYRFPVASGVAPPPATDVAMHVAGSFAGLIPASLIAVTGTRVMSKWRITNTRAGAFLVAPRVRLVGLLAMMLVINVAFDAGYSFASLINVVGWLLLIYFAWIQLPSAPRAAGLVTILALCVAYPRIKFTAENWNSSLTQRVMFPPRPGSHVSALRTRLVKPADALQAWASSKGQEKPPKIAILAASGGGYRAAIWTALVIDRLSAESGSNARMPGLIDGVRLVSGASGGMLAGAYFIAQQQQACGASRATGLVDQIRQDVARHNSSPGNRSEKGIDSLSAIARRWVKADLLGLGPGRAKDLEEQWGSLCSTLGELKAAEQQGVAPSFIIAPTVVEDGRPMLISNLNLSNIAPNAFGSASAPKAVAEQELSRQQYSMFSGAWDFSQVFPETHSHLKLQTAVRFSASFPYITPAEELPTQPRRRLVDAGYSDNYGVMSAVAYLADSDVKAWIERTGARVLILEIWSHARDGQQKNCELPDTDSANHGAQLFDGLTEPWEAVFSAREVSMIERNQQLIRNLESSYGKGYIRHFIIDSPAAVSLSWYLPEREITCLKQQWESKAMSKRIDALAKVWNED